MEILANFVVFEGGDGSGTTTQLKMLKNHFAAAGNKDLPPLFDTFEPTGGPVGRLIRQGLRGEIPLKNESIAFLFAADRYEHVYGPGGILERCGQGELAVCDRYLYSSLAYQGITCGEELPARLNSGFPAPELLFFFDIDPETAQKRVDRRDQKEIYEYLEFQVQVRERYKTLLSKYETLGRVEIIDAAKPPEEVFAHIWRVMEKMPIFKR